MNYEFRRVYNRGSSFVSPVVVAYCLRKKSGGIRVGITSSKKTGNAVKRNRARRLIREALRGLMPELSGNWDIVLVSRTATAYKKSTDVEVALRRLFKRAGVISR